MRHWKIEKNGKRITAIEDWKSQIVTLIGEPVTTTSLAALIEKEYHYKTKGSLSIRGNGWTDWKSGFKSVW